MKWCQEHWDGLRDEIARQGLDSLITTSPERLAENITRELTTGETTLDTFDPLMNAFWSINAFIGESLGPGGQLVVLMHDGCPVCKANEAHSKFCPAPDCDGLGYEKFFVNAVQDQKAFYQELLDGR